MATQQNNQNVTTLTDGQMRVMSILGLISGTLSVLGSSVIIYRAYKNRRNSSPYDRLMLCLSFCDIVASISFGYGPFMLPEATSERVWARGTNRSCSALGFLTQFAFAAVWYNGLLSVYYLMTVRFGVKRRDFARKYEPYMHFLTLSFFLSTAASGLFIGLYSELEITQGCWIGQYPANCEANNDCRGTWIGWIFGGIPFLFTFFSLPINNIVIFMYVRKRLGTTNGVALEEQSATQRREDHQLRIREVATQGFFYVVCFYICYTPAFIIRVLESMGMKRNEEARAYWVLLLNSLLLPLQGILNVYIYSRPNYLRLRNAYPERNTWWVLRECLVESDIPTLTAASRNADSSQLSTGKRSNMQKAANQPGSTSARRSFESSGSSRGKSLEIVPEDSQEDMSSSAFEISQRSLATGAGSISYPIHQPPTQGGSSFVSFSGGPKKSAFREDTTPNAQPDISKPQRVSMDGSIT